MSRLHWIVLALCDRRVVGASKFDCQDNAIANAVSVVKAGFHAAVPHELEERFIRAIAKEICGMDKMDTYEITRLCRMAIALVDTYVMVYDRQDHYLGKMVMTIEDADFAHAVEDKIDELSYAAI